MITEGKEVHIGIVGEFGAARVSPRQLLAACQGAAGLDRGASRVSARMTFRAKVFAQPLWGGRGAAQRGQRFCGAICCLPP